MPGTTELLRTSETVPADNKKRAVLNKSRRSMDNRSNASKIESCVRKLKAKGREKSSAFAICTESVKGK